MTPRILFAAVLLMSGSFVLAQAARESGATRPSLEVSGGFALSGGGTLDPGMGFTAGFDARVQGPFYLAAETTWLNESHEAAYGSTDMAILAGPRYRLGGATALFADFLAGGDVFINKGQAYTHQYNDGKSFALAADVGADIAWGRHLALRPEGGFFYTPLTNSTYSGAVSPAHISLTRARFTLGLAYRF